jgi:hypothetical protein
MHGRTKSLKEVRDDEDRKVKVGTRLVAKHKGKEYRCEAVAAEEGKVRYRLADGREFTSPSSAGSAVMGGVACNGWRWWSVDGQEPARQAPSAPKSAKTAAAKPKAGKKAKARAKAKKHLKVAGGSNGEPLAPVEKPINCGDCGQEFPSSREAADHMRDEHGSQEAAGSGGR